MNQTAQQLPAYLRKYVAEQPAGKYTARDHAVWRYIMRQSRAYFQEHAVPIYLAGLEKTGITLDRIPQIEEMDRKLREIGWGAVPVVGFIPPAAFLDFQARRILPIASDMRTIEHVHYTPAPDIVHEAAGHAPILADPEYSDYLTKYAAMAQKAIFAKEDLDLYEAIRTLSDVKENPDSTPEMIKQAEERLKAAQDAVTFISEANKTARMNWWTVEYGLLGPLDEPKIYGAGLLSSVGESQTCLSPKVRKIPLTVACVEQSYDITEPQPQLFVAESISHLVDVLEEFESTLAFRRGGRYGLEQALSGRTVTTAVLDSGIEISGVLVEFLGKDDDIEYLRYEGPVQLGHGERELPGQGPKQHPTGFSTPIGRFEGKREKLPQDLTDADLEAIGIVRGNRARLTLTSGFVVEGKVEQLLREGGKLIAIKWQDCTVTRQGKVYFQPEWGDFDMAVGTRVVSVYGGPCDREAYGTHDVGSATTTPGRKSPYTADELKRFETYDTLRRYRADKVSDPEIIGALVDEIERNFRDEWLLRLEALELLRYAGQEPPLARRIEESLLADAKTYDENRRWLVQQGIALSRVAD